MKGLPIRRSIRLTIPSAVRTRVVGYSASPAASALSTLSMRSSRVTVDAEGNRRHQDDAEEFKTGEYLADRRQRHREAEACEGIAKALDRSTHRAQDRTGSIPRQSAACRAAIANNPAGLPFRCRCDATEPAHQNDRKTDQNRFAASCTFQAPAASSMNVTDTPASVPTKRGARRDLADVGRDEAADHQDEAPGRTPRPDPRPSPSSVRQFFPT